MSAFFSKSDKSRSIRAKRSAFSIKIWSAPTHLRKSGLATPICAAWHRRCLFNVYHRRHEYSWIFMTSMVFTCKRRRGLRRSAQCARRDTTPTTTRKICMFFFTGLDRSRLTNLNGSRFVRFWKRMYSFFVAVVAVAVIVYTVATNVIVCGRHCIGCVWEV